LVTTFREAAQPNSFLGLTTDGGKTFKWVPVTGKTVSSVCLSPDMTAVVGTWDGFVLRIDKSLNVVSSLKLDPEKSNNVTDLARSDSGTLYACTDIDAYRSDDGGTSWRKVGATVETGFGGSIHLHPSGSPLALGRFRYKTAENLFQEVLFKDEQVVSVFPISTSLTFASIQADAGTRRNALVESTGNGPWSRTQLTFTTPPPNADRLAKFSHDLVAADPSGTYLHLFGNGNFANVAGAAVSNDGGKTWTMADSEMRDTTAAFIFGDNKGLAFGGGDVYKLGQVEVSENPQ
jgi:hypothetical protein